MKLAELLRSLSWKAALAVACALVLVEIVVIGVVTSKETPTIPPAAPALISATLTPAAGAAGVQLALAAQSANATIVRIETRWPDGHVDDLTPGCRPDGRSYGGETERRTIDHAHRAASVEVRLTARQCVYPDVREQVGAWQTVRLAPAAG